MSKSWKGAPTEGRPVAKPKYEPTIKEELEEMNPEEIYVVVSEWKPVDSPYELDETVAHHRTESGAHVTLRDIADGQGIALGDKATEFTIEGPGHSTEYTLWYITTEVLED